MASDNELYQLNTQGTRSSHFQDAVRSSSVVASGEQRRIGGVIHSVFLLLSDAGTPWLVSGPWSGELGESGASKFTATKTSDTPDNRASVDRMSRYDTF